LSSYQATVSRLFRPSSGIYLDMVFIVFIALITLVLWVGELKKMFYSRTKIMSYLKKGTNWMNNFTNFILLAICVLFVIKEVVIEYTMQTYLSNKKGFTNFYSAANYSNCVIYLASFLLATLMAKLVRLLRFMQGWNKFGEAYERCAYKLFNATIIMLIVVLAYSITGYLIFGLGAIHSISSFNSFTTSFGTMFGAFRSFNQVYECFLASPIFSTVFFFSYFFWFFLIISKLFVSVVIEALRNTKDKVPMMRKLNSTIDSQVPSYFLKRVKLRLGLEKTKQYRPTVHFEGLSRSSSFDTLSTTDSFQTYFNPGRISQCSDVSGFSEFTSATHSDDHSISVFDYLTLGQQPYEDREPMDSVHMQHLYDRLESYSVELMLKKIDRVQKLSDEVLSVETDLLEMSEPSNSQKASTINNEKNSPANQNTSNDKDLSTYSSITGSGVFSRPKKEVVSRLDEANKSVAANKKSKRYLAQSANAAVNRNNEVNQSGSDLEKNRPYSDGGNRNKEITNIAFKKDELDDNRINSTSNDQAKEAW